MLTDDDFTYSNVDYEITRVGLSGGVLFVRFNKAIPAALKSALTLNVDGAPFSLAAGTLAASNTQVNWSNSGLSWSVGDTVSLSLTAPGTTGLIVDAIPACGSVITDTSVTPETGKRLTPAPASEAEVEYRVLASTNGEWLGSLPIETRGFSGMASTNTFDGLRTAFPGFRGFEYRLKDTPAVTATCTWTFEDGDEVETAEPRPQRFPRLERLPVDDSVQPLPVNRMGEDGTSRNAYCFLGEGNSNGTELVRYPDGRIAETAGVHSPYIRALYACR